MVSEEELLLFWKSLGVLEYLVMRNYDTILRDINNGGDIDLLVSCMNKFIKITNAIPLNNSERCFNYLVQIGDSKVPVDVRTVGDGYYDTEWEKHMLANRKKYMESFFIMDSTDFLYSLMYHCLIHKKKIPSKYITFFRENGINSKKELEKELTDFMHINKFIYIKPQDTGVHFNKKNTLRLKFYQIMRKSALDLTQ